MSVHAFPAAASPISSVPRARVGRPLRALLISDDPGWIVPVREAVAAAGGVVETVTARAAIARLAGRCDDLSHILVDRRGAGPLVETFIDLTTDIASPDIVLLVLDPDGPGPGGPRTILTPSRRSVAAALAVPHVRAEGNEPILPAAELMRVMDGEFIRPRYQPIVRMNDRTATAVEVLARLNHPVHGAVTPDWFVPRFEDSGLAFSLTDLISTHAFSDRAGPHFRGLGLAVAVNYPLKVLSHPLAAVSLDRKRAALGLTPDQVIVELTESRPVEDFVTLGRSMETLRKMGYRISIDDVGPAVKNFERLLTLPFTGLKLDKSIVRMLGSLGPGAAQAPRAIEQAQARGLNVVAEGVETREMWDRLLALGVQEAQGFFIARPMPAAAIPLWWDGWRAGR